MMVDTSVWVDHFRHGNDALVRLLEFDQVLTHRLIVGEIACGTPPSRNQTLSWLGGLKQAQQASVQETIDFIQRERLYGMGCGLVDIMLLASTMVTPGAKIWTLDKRLCTMAERLGVMHRPVD
ncbi:type II toxin-antitoxin system VapC family toxin [Pseudomonas sp. gcc21]|uniref:type II toxin-antitoxin system VapC family toxin n=1 Tax=Pseudomonas sp. gcc21 TaxID=2726989 RepID=UPI00273F09B1|nr:type II toxin-antitoxin system VapC family toxin [Pseudomonas sp. gcc21]